MTASYYSVWLVPQEPDLSYFQNIINQLAKRFGTVPFCPHVTLYSGPIATDIDQVGAAQPLTLDVVKLDHTDRFAKTLYIQLALSPTLDQLVKRLVGTRPNARLDPHLSLLYHKLEPASRQRLLDTLVLPRPVIRFNQIQVIAAPQNFETQAHVASLRCVHRRLLTTP